MTWTQPLGPNAHLRCVKTATLKHDQGQLLARIAQETDSTMSTHVSRATAAGDERKLRGIPAIGRGVQGVINETQPGHGLFKEDRP